MKGIENNLYLYLTVRIEQLVKERNECVVKSYNSKLSAQERYIEGRMADCIEYSLIELKFILNSLK